MYTKVNRHYSNENSWRRKTDFPGAYAFRQTDDSRSMCPLRFVKARCRSVLLGCKNRDEVLSAVKYYGLNDNQRDYTEVLGTLKNDFKGNCVYCSHCQPCPSEIDMAAVNKYLGIARLDLENIPPSIRSHYHSLSNGGDECIICGSCESRCPFGVTIIENMA